jgi:hypothetical protein
MARGAAGTPQSLQLPTQPAASHELEAANTLDADTPKQNHHGSHVGAMNNLLK